MMGAVVTGGCLISLTGLNILNHSSMIILNAVPIRGKRNTATTTTQSKIYRRPAAIVSALYHSLWPGIAADLHAVYVW